MAPPPHPDDRAHMQAALALARRGLGHTWPNPSVGCVIVQDGRVVGRGRTAPGGRPHAEPTALAEAGAAARGATAYVTLEPCCHRGVTPPCTAALITAGVVRVVVGTRDPDKRVDGAGIVQLRKAGIAVTEDVEGAAAREVIAGFSLKQRAGRPLVTLKLASTLDGRIATHSGESRWITGEDARRAAHALRGRHDAVMVGVGTVVADDPDLTCRLPGFRPTPVVRVVVDSHLRTSLTSRLVATAAETPTWILLRAGTDPDRRRAFSEAGVVLMECHAAAPGIDLFQGLRHLATAGITSLLVEGGAQLAASLLRNGLVDRIAWFHAPGVMGADGWPAVQGLGVHKLAEMPRFRHHSSSPLGDDMLSEYERME
jgi:diaminohydroxyphosphoribosylaminopyrimidine deaminase / 5-amino-6-(5-phosphoribosylamino)uracil reductase